MLEKINRDTLFYVCELMKLVADNSKVTEQSYFSLSKLIGPSVFRPNKISTKDVMFTEVIQKTFAFIIEHVDKLKLSAFKNEVEEEIKDREEKTKMEEMYKKNEIDLPAYDLSLIHI